MTPAEALRRRKRVFWLYFPLIVVWAGAVGSVIGWRYLRWRHGTEDYQ